MTSTPEPTPGSEYVRLEVEGGVATIRIDRPKMNPLNAAIQDEIGRLADEAAVRDDIAAVVVYGGERVFAAGADIKEMAGLSYADMARRIARLQACFNAVARIPKPTVAAVSGYALGAGCELAMCCDYRIAGESATLGQPEVLLGVIPGAGGTQRLPRLVGPSRAKELLYTGRHVTADEALRIGMIDEIVPDAEVYSAATAWAGQFVGGPALALQAIKEAVDRGLETDLETGLAIEGMLFASSFATDDRTIGMTSFVQEGPGKARFTGR